jgi:pilus assembly protein CpaB
MRNTRAIVMLGVSLLIGLGASLMAAGWIQAKGDSDTSMVVVAGSDIELGSRISVPMLKAVKWPSGTVPEGSFSNVQDLNERVVKSSVLRGEPILEAKLAPVGTKGGLSAVIKEGNRAITVRVNDVIGVAGFALPGNYVDVVVSTQQDGASSGSNDGKQISKIVLSHILVLAVAQEAGRDETRPKVVSAVTLEVTPSQAEKLDLARSVGTLSLVLRNQIDSQSVDTSGITKKQLLSGSDIVLVKHDPLETSGKRPVQRTSVPSKRNCIEVIKGGSRNLECFATTLTASPGDAK